jgi:NDP-sugar pyrophosphorylase family protein
MTDLTLVVMAAGLGSRFGGDKQLAEVGPSGEAIFSYTMHDAAAAGVGRLVLVVRSEIEQAVGDHARSFAPAGMEVVTVCQDRHGPARDKPWGTGHAVLCAAEAVHTPFLVCNADDLYGPSAVHALARHLQNGATGHEAALVGFRLSETLSPIGGVSRGVCNADANGLLTDIVETHGIERTESGDITSDSGALADDTLVSMSIWAFPHVFFDQLAPRFDAFVAQAEDPKAEFLLPEEVGWQMDQGIFDVRVLATDASWSGVTHADDLEPARASMAERVRSGEYPTPLGHRGGVHVS